jgi:hypothetical protein
MKSTLMIYFLGLAICFFAVSVLNEPLAAESIENQCRASVRAEMAGANCRIAEPNRSTSDPCRIPEGPKYNLYIDKVMQCVARGAGRVAR